MTNGTSWKNVIRLTHIFTSVGKGVQHLKWILILGVWILWYFKSKLHLQYWKGFKNKHLKWFAFSSWRFEKQVMIKRMIETNSQPLKHLIKGVKWLSIETSKYDMGKVCSRVTTFLLK